MESDARRLCDLGKEFLERGEPEEALRCYERAIDADPHDSEAWCGRGKAAYDLGRLDRADRDFRRALRLAKHDLEAEDERRAGAGGRGRTAARRWWADPRTRPYLRALHGHGLCRFWLGSYEDAARIFRRLLRLAPTDPLDVGFLVGETYLRMGRIERAVRELSRLDDDPDALYNLGLARFYAGDFAGSVGAFRRGIFANLYLPDLLTEQPAREEEADGREDARPGVERDAAGGRTGEGAPGAEGDGAPEHPTDAGASTKGLDGKDAARDYVDRCGDLWFGRPVLQRWLEGVRRHPLVEADLVRHREQVAALGNRGLSAGERARLEGENTSLRSAERLSASDRAVAADVLAKVFSLPS